MNPRILFLLSLLLLILAACAPPDATPVQQGALNLQVDGLPQGVDADITVSGPAGFAPLTVTKSTPASIQVPPGDYTIAARPVSSNGLTHVPYPPSRNVHITPNHTYTATVTYSTADPDPAEPEPTDPDPADPDPADPDPVDPDPAEPSPIDPIDPEPTEPEPTDPTEPEPEPEQPSLTAVAVASGLPQPTAIAHAGDGSGRLFITLHEGKIMVFDGQRVLPEPFLDISSLVSGVGPRGLLDIAFHPNYSSNGLFYVNYVNVGGNTTVARYRVSATNPNRADAQSATTLLVIDEETVGHFGGQTKFGPDGYLYVSVGDGGPHHDPNNNAQNRRNLLGTILRLDVDGGSPYIPADNPFVNNPGARDEIWAYGLRNPWRFSFDRVTGDLFIADVGQDAREEVNVQPAASRGGENYGWRRMEGSLCFIPAQGCNDGTLVLPALEYDTTEENCSVTGGYRYRGRDLAGLYGVYLYSDFCSGRIWGATPRADGRWTSRELLHTGYSVVTFGEDETGELYLADYSRGVIYRLENQLERPSAFQP